MERNWRVFIRHQKSWSGLNEGKSNGRSSADPRHADAPGRLVVWCPSNRWSLKLFGPGQGWGNFWGRVPKFRILFWEILSRVEIWVYKRHICEYSSDVLVPINIGPVFWAVLDGDVALTAQAETLGKTPHDKSKCRWGVILTEVLNG